MATSLKANEHLEVQKLCAEFERGDDGSKQVYIRDQLDEIFKPYMLPWRLLPKQVGIHPLNRDEAAMTPAGVWLRGGRILASGFSFKAIGKLWAFEDHPVTRHIQKHTLKVTSGDPLFATMNEDVKVGPANWTHSNHFVCMVVDQTLCTHRDIPIVDGRIDKAAIFKDPKNCRMVEFAEQGQTFHVFPYWVEEMYPLLPKVFQSACNQEQQVQEGEGWQQLLKKISGRAAEIIVAGKQPNNNEICKAVLRSQPPHAIDVPDMVDYNSKWGGGKSEVFVKDVLRFCRTTNVDPSVHVPGRIFKALASMDFGAETLPSFAVNAVLKRVASSERVVDGVACSYKPSDISSIVGNKDKRALFLEADKIMRRCAKILDENGSTEAERSIHESWLQLTLVDHVMSKPSKGGETFTDLAAISKIFLSKVFVNLDTLADIDDSPPSYSGASIVEYSADGHAIDVPKMALHNKGFSEGCTYVKAKQTAVWKLISIAGDGTSKLQAYSPLGKLTEETIEITGVELAHEYKAFDKSFKLLNEYPSNEGKYNKLLIGEVFEGRVKDCLLTLASTVPNQTVVVRLSPARGVFANGDITDLCLAPTTRSVSFCGDKKKHSSLPKCIVIDPKGTATEFALISPPLDKDFCSAFFVVQPTHDEQKVNVKRVEKKVNFIVPTTGKLGITGYTYTAKIPCYVNVGTIKNGSELFFFREKEVAKPHEYKALGVVLSAKKQKLQ
jgi:hypothetical protein